MVVLEGVAGSCIFPVLERVNGCQVRSIGLTLLQNPQPEGSDLVKVGMTTKTKPNFCRYILKKSNLMV